MFGLIKSPPKENPPPADVMTFTDLHPGCVIGFGFMPQKSISGRRVPVVEVNSYIFDEDSFTAYRLESDNADINLIVADEGDPAGTYLALSLRVEPRLFDALFPGYPPSGWFDLKEEDAIEAKPVVLGMQPGWMTSNYTVAVIAKGRFLEGDYRLRKPADRTRLSHPFDYVLLVDEDNEYALEAEKYEDGRINVFVTVYRAATDIGEIARAPKSPVASVEIIPHVAPTDLKEGASESTTQEIKAQIQALTAEGAGEPAEAVAIKAEEITLQLQAEETQPVEPQAVAAVIPKASPNPFVVLAMPMVERKETQPDAVQPEAVQPEAAQPEAAQPEAAQSALEAIAVQAEPTELPVIEPQKKADAEATMALVAALPDISPARSKFGRIQTAGAAERDGAAEVLACNVTLAGRLIDEAQRNQMLLSELIRKVIDLPARVKEEVLIPFTLESGEQAELARRYNLPAADAEGVKGMIIEELQRFVGEKK